jgi:hypothetical protein
MAFACEGGPYRRRQCFGVTAVGAKHVVCQDCKIGSLELQRFWKEEQFVK